MSRPQSLGKAEAVSQGKPWLEGLSSLKAQGPLALSVLTLHHFQARNNKLCCAPVSVTVCPGRLQRYLDTTPTAEAVAIPLAGGRGNTSEKTEWWNPVVLRARPLGIILWGHLS